MNRIFLDDHYFLRSLTMKWLFLMLIPENLSPRRLSTTSLWPVSTVWSWHLLVIYNLCKHSFQWTLIVWFVLGCNNSKIIEKLFVILLLLSFNPIRCRGCKGPFIKHFKDLQIFVEIILHSSGDTWPNWKFVYPFKKFWY